MTGYMILAPELYCLFTSAVFLTLAMAARPQPRRDYLVALALAAFGVVVSLAAVQSKATLMAGAYRVDLFSQVFKVMLAAGLFLVVSLCAELKGISERRHSDFYFLLALCTLAMMILASSVELVTLYVALELTSYCLYIMVAVRRGYEASDETGLKYFLMGAVTSAVMLFGMALLFGAVGTTYLDGISQLLPEILHSPAAFIGLLLTLSAFFFKLALFPFHVWAPGVYEGAANQVTAYIATVSKVVAIALLARILSLSGGASETLVRILVGLAIASMTFGNLVAMAQKDLKRLFAYSAVAHAGYVLVGILSMTESGYAGAIFYALAYMIMSFTCFLVVVRVASDGSNLRIEELAGLHRRAPLLAAALMLGVFSLGGIPPTIGFAGKFFVFTAAMEKGYLYLVIISMINVAVSLYYYALVIKAAYLLEPEHKLPPVRLSLPAKLLAIAAAAAIILGGLFPGPFYALARTAARSLM